MKQTVPLMVSRLISLSLRRRRESFSVPQSSWTFSFPHVQPLMFQGRSKERKARYRPPCCTWIGCADVYYFSRTLFRKMAN
ncbi:hypothetical protein M758_5G030700 [Ceratodon purpureus]|nr:hypothetical protein M758_5G030700 [Ceratodon purpureus]